MSKLRGEKIVGNAGESLTVFKLSMMGYAASLVKQDGVDIAVVGGEGLKVAQRVEVKTVLQSDDMGRYSFTISKFIMVLVPLVGCEDVCHIIPSNTTTLPCFGLILFSSFISSK